MRNIVWGGLAVVLALLPAPATLQGTDGVDGGPAAGALHEMVETERAFARAAHETNWRLAFLEYFADGTTDFHGQDVKERLRRQPDPPDGHELLWEPRFGDMSASGDLGWLTGPAVQRTQGTETGAAHGNYASIWKRQPDGTFRVILDVGVNLPAAASFANGFVRAPAESRYTGPEQGVFGKPSLLEADGQLTGEMKTTHPAAAYARSLAPFARVHRHGTLPLANRTAALAWAQSQPAWSAGETRFAEVSQAGDLGYTWGSYAVASGIKAKGQKEESGHYVRVWSRDAQGKWQVVLEVTQPEPAKPPA